MPLSPWLLQWRAPRVNETCCKRPKLAELLTAGEAHWFGFNCCCLPLAACSAPGSGSLVVAPTTPCLPYLLRCIAVAEDGPQVLYTGRYAKPLVRDIQAAGGRWQGLALVLPASCPICATPYHVMPFTSSGTSVPDPCRRHHHSSRPGVSSSNSALSHQVIWGTRHVQAGRQAIAVQCRAA